MYPQTIRYKHNRFQQLRGFCAVVELRSVSKAAARLRLTQPTVSLQVQALERELGTLLFERRGPKIELTPEGKLLYELGRPLVESLSGLDSDFEAHRNSVERGGLSIAAGESTIQYVLPTTVQKFSAAHPGISLALNNVTGVDGLQQLRDRRVDFCVGPLLNVPPDLEFEPIISFDSCAHHLPRTPAVKTPKHHPKTD
jgi:DNA-binding transcriptional LysR family regulator